MSNSPHPFSITSYGITLIVRTGTSKLACSVNDTCTRVNVMQCAVVPFPDASWRSFL